VHVEQDGVLLVEGMACLGSPATPSFDPSAIGNGYGDSRVEEGHGKMGLTCQNWEARSIGRRRGKERDERVAFRGQHLLNNATAMRRTREEALRGSRSCYSTTIGRAGADCRGASNPRKGRKDSPGAPASPSFRVYECVRSCSPLFFLRGRGCVAGQSVPSQRALRANPTAATCQPGQSYSSLGP
jgi:hypothetical protein